MARQVDKTIPNLENATPGFLIDEIERIRTEASRLKFLENVYKQALDARVSPEQRAGNALIEGSVSLGSYTQQTQERIDPDAVKEYLKNDPEGLKQVTKKIEFAVLTTKPRIIAV